MNPTNQSFIQFFRFLAILSVLSMSVIGFSCKDKEGDSSKLESENLEYFMFRVTADGMKVYQEPGLGAKVLLELTRGQKIIDKKTTHGESFEMEVGGKKVKSVWKKVALKDGRVGWVFGGGLERVHELRNVEEESNFLKDYKSLIESSPKTCEGILKAQKTLLESKEQGENFNQGFEMFFNYYVQSLELMGESFYGSDGAENFRLLFDNPDNKPIPTQVKSKKEEWKKCGASIAFEMDEVYITEDPNYIHSNFSSRVGESIRAFLAQRKIELERPFAIDGGLAITPMELAERLDFWSDFYEKNPNFPFSKSVHVFIENYEYGFQNGVDNSPIYSSEPPYEILPEWKKAHEWFIDKAKNPNMKQKIRDNYEIMKKNGFKKISG